MLGAGTQANPYLISSPADLDAVRNNRTRGVYYELTSDIDMSSWGNWNPIAYYDNSNWVSGFEGNFDGKGFKIKNLTITKSTGIYLGLFGQFFFGTIQNVGLENVTINGSNCRFIGALIGYGYSTTIKNCYVVGGNITSQDESGGLLGKVDTCTIENSYSNIPVNLDTSYYGGGFVGSVDSNTTITNCYSGGKVTYSQSSSYNGKSGFAGFIRDNAGITFENCFYDKEVSTQPTSPVNGIYAKTSDDMKTQSTYTGWDFNNTWVIQNAYPTLKVFGVPIVPKKETITVDTYANPIRTRSSKSTKSTKLTQSFLSPIYTVNNRKISTNRDVETYTLPIHSSVQKSNRTVRSSTHTVDTYISSLYSSHYKESKTMKELLSYTGRIQSHVDILIPIDNKVVNAYLSVIHNPSRASFEQNMTTLQIVENPSICEVIT